MVLKISGGGNRRRDTWRVAIGSIQAGESLVLKVLSRRVRVCLHIYTCTCVCVASVLQAGPIHRYCAQFVANLLLLISLLFNSCCLSLLPSFKVLNKFKQERLVWLLLKFL